MNEEAAGARYENLFNSQLYYDQQHEQNQPTEGGVQLGAGYVKQGTSHEQQGYVKQDPPHGQAHQMQQGERINTTTGSNGTGTNLEHSIDSAANNIKIGHDQALIGGKRWNPSQTRVFDVFLSDNSRVRQPDIFAYDANKLGCDDRQSTKSDGDEEDDENEDDSRQDLDSRGLTLINTGQGRRVRLPAAGAGFVSKRSSSTKGRNLSLPLHPGMQRIDMMISRGTPPSTANESTTEGRLSVSAGTDNSDPLRLRSNSLPTPLSTANQGDKWPPQVETAFLSALKVIMKNGTSKIKLREKNYGRNELISLFIKHRCGEVRTKKQISSHIQVWKKSILNKVSNNIEINDFEKELLNLIEHGAAQTNDSWRLFEETFNDILDAEESNTDGSISSERSTPSGTSGLVIHSPCLGGANGFPHSALVGSLDYKKEPTTPLEYAQEIYSHLKSYKCVPVNVERQLYTPSSATSNPPISATSVPGEDSHKRIIEAAKEVETQQRRLIEELLQQQQPNNFKQRPPIKAPTTSSGIYPATHVEQQAHAPYSAPYSSASRPVHRYYGVSPQQQRLSYPILQQPSYSNWVPRVAQTAPVYTQVQPQGQGQGQEQAQGQAQGQLQGQLQQPVQQSPLQSQVPFHQQSIHQHVQAPQLNYQFRQSDQPPDDTQIQHQNQHQGLDSTEAQMRVQVHGRLHAQSIDRTHEHSLPIAQQHQPQRQLKLQALSQVVQSSAQPTQRVVPQLHAPEQNEALSKAEVRRQSAVHAQLHAHDKALPQAETKSQSQPQAQPQASPSQKNLPLAIQSSLKPNHHAKHVTQSHLPSSQYSPSVQLQKVQQQKEENSPNADVHGADSLKSEQ